MAEEDLKAELERLRAENEALKKPGRGQISVRVSEKGGVSVYGLGRFPVTLYKEQWEKLLAMTDDLTPHDVEIIDPLDDDDFFARAQDAAAAKK